MNIAVCDDDKVFLYDIKKLIQRTLANKNIEIKIYTYEDADKLMESVGVIEFDLYFLDIDIGMNDGIDVAKAISEKNKSAIFIFVTSHNSRVYEVFSLNTFGFIRKSHLDIDFEEVMERLVDKYSYIAQSYHVILDNKKKYSLYLDNVEYIERIRNTVEVNLNNSVTLKTMYRLITQLPFSMENFIETHRGVFVNLKYIKKINKDSISLYSGKRVMLSRRRKKDVERAFENFMLE